jgi:hypothetical protein
LRVLERHHPAVSPIEEQAAGRTVPDKLSLGVGRQRCVQDRVRAGLDNRVQNRNDPRGIVQSRFANLNLTNVVP